MSSGKYADNKTTAFKFEQLTPSDSTEYPPEAGLKALYISGAGDVVLEDHFANSVTLSSVAKGSYLYMRPFHVMAATTATVVGLFS